MNTQLSFKMIFVQTTNFVKNRFLQIMIVCIVLGVINALLSETFISQETLNQLVMESDIQSVLPVYSKTVFLMLSLSLIMTSIMIAAVYNLSKSNSLSPQLLVSRLLSIFLNMLGFFVLYFFIIILTILILSLVLMIVGAILPNSLVPTLSLIVGLFILIGIMTVYYMFVGSIIDPTSKRFFTLFAESHQLTKHYWKSSASMIMVYILAIVILSFLAQLIQIDNVFINIIFSALSNLINIFTIAYFYRLYQLIGNKPQTDVINP